MSGDFSYDKVIYPSYVFQHIRPDRLGAVAALHGINVSRIETARILELGCGDGANLLSVAYSMPSAECLGIDLSKERICEAASNAEAIGIRNARFLYADICDVKSEEIGTFDFIIAHGLFSWVPASVRSRVLEIYRDCLARSGIGYISYNALPGWHLRRVARDAMLFHTENIADPKEKVRSALEFLEFLRYSAKSESIYQRLLEAEIENSNDRPAANIFHDDLAEINQPFYFTEFVKEITPFQLKFVAESEPVAFFDRKFSENTRAALDRLWDDYLRREQYLDFITGSRFRSSLVCRSGENPIYKPDPALIDNLWLSTQSTPLAADAVLDDDSTVEFRGPFNSTFELNHPFVKSVLGMLAAAWPRRVPFAEVTNFLRSKFSQIPDDRFAEMMNLFRAFVVELFHSMIIELRAFYPAYKLEISDRPETSAFARWQIRAGFEYVTTMTGVNLIPENDLMRQLITLFDGSRSVTDVLEELKSSDPLVIAEYCDPQSTIRQNLGKFLNAGLLVG
ncbi:MAG: hypothetical protein C4324_10500 [Blastocatellia bacterium]